MNELSSLDFDNSRFIFNPAKFDVHVWWWINSKNQSITEETSYVNNYVNQLNSVSRNYIDLFYVTRITTNNTYTNNFNDEIKNKKNQLMTKWAKYYWKIKRLITVYVWVNVSNIGLMIHHDWTSTKRNKIIIITFVIKIISCLSV